MCKSTLISSKHAANLIMCVVSIIVLYSTSFFLDFIDEASWLQNIFLKISLVYLSISVIIIMVLLMTFDHLIVSIVEFGELYSIILNKMKPATRILYIIQVFCFVTMLILYAIYISNLLLALGHTIDA